jgi:hypothetical protein
LIGQPPVVLEENFGKRDLAEDFLTTDCHGFNPQNHGAIREIRG